MKENTKKPDSLPYSFVEEYPTNNERLSQMLEEQLELDLLERLMSQPLHATTELPAPEPDKSTIKKCEVNESKSREKHLPPLVDTSCIYEIGNDYTPEYEEFDIKEIGERLEYDLLQITDFQPPHTTTDKPAHILSYGVIPEPDKRGVYTAFIDFLPGDKVSQYYGKLLRQLEVALRSSNDTSAKRQKA